MSYDTVIEQIKAVPHEYLSDIENYIQYVLYRHSRNAKSNNAKNLSKYFGSVSFNKDALDIQKEGMNGIDFYAVFQVN